MRHPTSCGISLAGALFLAAMKPCPVRANDVERHLRDEYHGKVLVLRGFYSGEQLQYDSSGTLAVAGANGDWTTDGFVQIDGIQASGRTLRIKAQRLMIISGGQKGLRFAQDISLLHKNLKTARVNIQVLLAADDVSDQKANAVLSKIFLSAQDDFIELVPYYWKDCLRQGMQGKNGDCRLSPEIASIPGISAPESAAGSTAMTQSTSSAITDYLTADSGAPLKIGRGVKPPMVITQHEPSFSDQARKAKYQGTIMLGLIVDQNGIPQSIQILRPLGAGLDARAVHAVENWRFRPAQKDGHPVPVQIAIEVDFHLY